MSSTQTCNGESSVPWSHNNDNAVPPLAVSAAAAASHKQKAPVIEGWRRARAVIWPHSVCVTHRSLGKPTFLLAARAWRRANVRAYLLQQHIKSLIQRPVAESSHVAFAPYLVAAKATSCRAVPRSSAPWHELHGRIECGPQSVAESVERSVRVATFHRPRGCDDFSRSVIVIDVDVCVGTDRPAHHGQENGTRALEPRLSRHCISKRRAIVLVRQPPPTSERWTLRLLSLPLAARRALRSKSSRRRWSRLRLSWMTWKYGQSGFICVAGPRANPINVNVRGTNRSVS